MGSGMEGSTLTAIVSAAAAFTVSIGTYAWRARGIQADLEKRIDKKVEDLRDRILRDTGEGLTALRQKAVDMEIWNRDNFVRKTEFQNSVDSFTRSIDSLRTEMNGQYARLNDKMDQIIQGKVGPTAPHR